MRDGTHIRRIVVALLLAGTVLTLVAVAAGPATADDEVIDDAGGLESVSVDHHVVDEHDVELTNENGSAVVPQGGVAEFELVLHDDVDELGVVVGGDSVDYEAEAVVDAEGADVVRVRVDTYAAGTDDPRTITAVDETGTERDVVHFEEVRGADRDEILTAGIVYDVDVAATDDLDTVRTDPDALGYVYVEERDPVAVEFWRANAEAFADVETAADVQAAMDAGTLEPTDRVVFDAEDGEVLVHRIHADGLEGMLEATDEDDATERFLTLLESAGGIDVTIEQTADSTQGNRLPKVVTVSQSADAVTVIEAADESELYVALEIDEHALDLHRRDRSAPASFADGDRFRTTVNVTDGWLLGEDVPPGTPAEDATESAVAGWTATEAATDPAEWEGSFDRPIRLEPTANQTVGGETDLEPGTEFQVLLRSNDSEDRYNLVDDVVVDADGRFVAEFDLGQAATPSDTIRVTTTREVDIEPVDGEVIATDHAGDRSTSFATIAGERFWAGQEVVVGGFEEGEVVEIWETDDDGEPGQFRRQRTANDAGEIMVRTRNLNPEDDYTLVTEDDGTSGVFFITEQTMDEFEFDDRESTELEIESNRAGTYDLEVSADGLDADDLEGIFGDAVVAVDDDGESVTIAVSTDDESLDADFSDVDPGEYAFSGTVTDTTATATTTITVSADVWYAPYVDENGVATLAGVSRAIDDWRTEDLTLTELAAVIDSWRTDTPIEG